ncbi:hypothetical protein L6452_35813 [Arctium lappa]|uniref:Uncharacterized protein n=1 Tax=Arctium lappa TaxID=4217 RepID=A0ACB8Y8C9_ARCLA|nr:hypothetical protein L6452_35813 [Arctium lappa]
MDPPRATGRAFQVTTEEAKASENVVSANNHAEILCAKKMVRILVSNDETVTVYGKRQKGEVAIIIMVKARKCLLKGCSSFLAYVIDAKLEKKRLKDVKVVNEFPDVFPDDLPGLPPDRQVEFKIDLAPGEAPIARAPYRLAPSEMKEMMGQLQDLLEKGFISFLVLKSEREKNRWKKSSIDSEKSSISDMFLVNKTTGHAKDRKNALDRYPFDRWDAFDRYPFDR